MMAVSRLSHSMPASKLGAAPACRIQRNECLISRHCNMNEVLSNRCITVYHMNCHGICPPDCPVCSGTPTGSRCLRQVQAPLQRPQSLHEEFVRVCSSLLCSLVQWLFKSCCGFTCHKGESPQGKHAHALAMHAWPQLRPDGAVMRDRCHQAGTSSELLCAHLTSLYFMLAGDFLVHHQSH